MADFSTFLSTRLYGENGSYFSYLYTQCLDMLFMELKLVLRVSHFIPPTNPYLS